MTTSETAPRPPRPARPVAVLAVQESEWISPHIVRLTLGGDEFSELRTNDFTDKYVKIRFGDVTRTYTVRWIDLHAQRLAIEFVVHGTEGIAAPWAAQAEPGALISLSGTGGGYAPNAEHDWHLFIGDESALPAIAAALEALAADARGIAYLEVDEPIELAAPAGVELHWLERAAPGSQPHRLADALTSGAWLPGRVGVFAHGERESMKAVRAALKARDVPREQLSLSGYWAQGRTEDKFQAEKREPIGQIEA